MWKSQEGWELSTLAHGRIRVDDLINNHARSGSQFQFGDAIEDNRPLGWLRDRASKDASAAVAVVTAYANQEQGSASGPGLIGAAGHSQSEIGARGLLQRS